MSCNKASNTTEAVPERLADLEKTKAENSSGPSEVELDPSFVPAPISMTIAPKDLVLAEGTSATFTAIGHYPYGIKDLSKLVTWVSSDEGVLAFDDADSPNIARSRSSGDASVSATWKGVVGETKVTVEAAKITALDISGSEEPVLLRTTVDGAPVPTELQLMAFGVFTNQKIQNLSDSATWTSSNEEIAEVIEGGKGRIRCKAPGEISVTAEWKGIRISAQVTIEIAPLTLESIELSPDPVVVPLGGTVSLEATGHYSNGASKDITDEAVFASANPDVVDLVSGEQGGLISKALGQTEISATLAGVTGVVQVVTSAAVLQSLTIAPKDVDQPLGVKLQYQVMGTYSDGTEIDLTSAATWSTSDSTLATMSNAAGEVGLMSSTAMGSLEVSVQFGGFSDTTSLTITNAELTRIDVTPDEKELPKGEQALFTAIGTFTDGTVLDITQTANWVSANAGFVTVNNTVGSKGLADAVGVGSTTLTVALDGIATSIPVNVTAAAVVSLAVQTTDDTIPLGLQSQYNAMATYTDDSVVNVTSLAAWSFDGTSTGYDLAATVSNDGGSKGLVSSVAEGKTKIIAGFEGFTAGLDITVTEKEIVSISVTGPDSTFAIQDDVRPDPTPITSQLTVTALYTDTSTADVTDPSGDPDLSITYTPVDSFAGFEVASVSGTGLISILQEGGSNIEVQLTSVEFGPFYDTFPISVSTDCQNGVTYGFYCIYFAVADSCANRCATAGGDYHPATRYIFGDQGPDANECLNAMMALDPSITSLDAGSANELDGRGLGCGVLNAVGSGTTLNVRYTSDPTNASDLRNDPGIASFDRVCACTK